MGRSITLLVLACSWLVGCGNGEGIAATDAASLEGSATTDPAVEDAHSDALSAKIKEGKGGVYGCGAAEITGGEPVYGKLTMTFEILPDGGIGKLQVEENGTGNEQIATCVQDQIRGWTFPAHPYGESIEYTYPFEVGF